MTTETQRDSLRAEYEKHGLKGLFYRIENLIPRCGETLYEALEDECSMDSIPSQIDALHKMITTYAQQHESRPSTETTGNLWLAIEALEVLTAVGRYHMLKKLPGLIRESEKSG